MALSELDRLTQAVATKKKAQLGEIDDAMEQTPPTQVAAASTVDTIKNRGKNMDAFIDNAVKGVPAKPATPAAPAAPAEPDDSAIGIHIPKPVKPATPPAQPGFFKRLLGDSGDVAAPAALATTAAVAAPQVPPLDMRAANAARAADSAAYTASRAAPGVAAPTAAPAAAAAEATPVSQAARLGERLAGAGNSVLNGVGKTAGGIGKAVGAVGDAAGTVFGGIRGAVRLATGPIGAGIYAATHSGDAAAPTLDNSPAHGPQGPDLSSVPPEQRAGLLATMSPGDQERAKAAWASPATAAAPTAAALAAPPGEASAARPALGAPAVLPPNMQEADQRQALVQSPTPASRAGYVSLGDAGYPGAQVFGRATGGSAKLNDFAGIGTGASPVKNGVDLGIKPGEVEAYKADLDRRAALGNAPTAPSFQSSKETQAALKSIQDTAAKLKDPMLSRKEQRQLMGQLEGARAAHSASAAFDQASFAAAHGNYTAQLGQFQHNQTTYDQQAQLGRKNAIDSVAAQTDAYKAATDRAVRASEAAAKQRAEGREQRKDNEANISKIIEDTVNGNIPGVKPGDPQMKAIMNSIARTKPLQVPGADGKPQQILFSAVDPNDAQHFLPALIAAARTQYNQGNSGGLFQNPISTTGQNGPLHESTLDQKVNYVSGKPSLGRLNDAFNPATPKLYTDDTGVFTPGQQLTKEEIEASQRKKKGAQ